MRNYDELLSAGNAAQIEKLRQNEHKKGFDDLEIGYIVKRLYDEFIETFEAFIEYSTTGDAEKLRHEFADVSNFSDMGILACDRIIKKNKKN